jgi:beta-glucosidase
VDFDFIGIQNYTREVVKHTYFIPFLNAKIIPASKRKVYHTGMNWEVHPESIYEMVKFYSHYEKVKEIIITENGASFQDEVRVNKVEDTERVIFLKTYIAEALRAKKTYPKLKGYFVWSITDNFEWAEGFKQRFGLVYVNFHSQRRVIKNSGYWYQAFLSES